jgi:predicted DNA-binding ribbon-helix-helix protein
MHRPFSIAVRNVMIAGHRTSVRLEPSIWEALKEIAQEKGAPLHELVTEVDRTRMAGSSLTSALRVYCVDFYRSKAASADAPSTSGSRRSQRLGTEPSARSGDNLARGPHGS